MPCSPTCGVTATFAAESMAIPTLTIPGLGRITVPYDARCIDGAL
ncbi:MAG TPA: hypothetical protein PLY24_05695 [Methanomassiliicoccales archaeon]|nr:hypothetical protein [Methanomassiliicoccales archaeon]